MLTVVPVVEAYTPWLGELLAREWGSARIVSRGKGHNALALPGFVALWEEHPAGAITYEITGSECEVVTLNSVREGKGLGSALLAAVREAAVRAGCRRLWLVTTNDNVDALSFYQKRGFRLVAVHREAITAARKQKPGIPLIGRHGIEIRDEIELELLL